MKPPAPSQDVHHTPGPDSILPLLHTTKMVPSPHLRYHQLIFFLITFIAAVRPQDEEPISLDADVTAVKIGDTAELLCSTTTNETLRWYIGTNSTVEKLISENGSLRVHANFTTGLLVIKDAVENDTGEYMCATSSGSHSITAELHVYKMPTYFFEGMIVFGINCGLVLVFITCSLYTHFRRKRSKAADKNHKRVRSEL